MIPDYGATISRMNADQRPALTLGRVNRAEASKHAGEVYLHLAWADFQWQHKAFGDALFRFENAEIAAAAAALALIGARVAQERRGISHGVKKHALVAFLNAAGGSPVSVEDVLETTHLRNIAAYDAASAEAFLNARSLDPLRQRAAKVRKALEAVLAEAGVKPERVAGWPPGAK